MDLTSYREFQIQRSNSKIKFQADQNCFTSYDHHINHNLESIAKYQWLLELHELQASQKKLPQSIFSLFP